MSSINIKTTEEFIQEANIIHNNKYSYIKTNYVGCMKLITITCPIHGDFTIRPNNHLSSKQGCQKCSKKHRPSLDEFIQQASIIHNNKYDYSNVIYTNNNTKIEIICPIHGSFHQIPTTHTDKIGGCKKMC